MINKPNFETNTEKVMKHIFEPSVCVTLAKNNTLQSLPSKHFKGLISNYSLVKAKQRGPGKWCMGQQTVLSL